MKKRLLLIVTGMLVFSASVSRGEGKADLFAEYNCKTGVVYKTVNGELLDMAILFPAEKKYKKTPLMLYTHGGGWGKLDKTVLFWPHFRDTLDILLANGIACATIEYRLKRRGISTVYDSVVDCKDAARFLVKHADEYGLDPERFGVWGGSAGGHLCLMTALAPDDLFPGDPALSGFVPIYRCVASYFPATTLMAPEVLSDSLFEKPGLFPSFLGGPYEENQELARKLSPAEYLNKTSPPILLLHGDKDQVLPYQNSVYMMEVSRQCNADVDLLTVTNGLHGFHGEDVHPTMEEINQIAGKFIIENLLAP